MASTSGFTVEGFAEGCKHAMAVADDKQAAARAFLEQTLAENNTRELIEALEAAIPPGADIGEMIVHTSPELTMLYARVPARFQSGIHNHTIFACIGQLTGEELNTLYTRDPDGGLRATAKMTAQAVNVIDLPPDAIHSIENPGLAVACALHLYGGDFGAVQDQRSLWTSGDHEEQPFSFPGLLRESARAMKLDGNEIGLQELVRAIPAVKPLVDTLSA